MRLNLHLDILKYLHLIEGRVVRNIIAFLDWELLFQGHDGEQTGHKIYHIKLQFKQTDGSTLERTEPVLALSRHYIMIPDAVILREKPESYENLNDSYLCYQEFLEMMDGHTDHDRI